MAGLADGEDLFARGGILGAGLAKSGRDEQGYKYDWFQPILRASVFKLKVSRHAIGRTSSVVDEMNAIDVDVRQQRSDLIFRHEAERFRQRIRDGRTAGHGRDAAVAVDTPSRPRIEQMIETTLGIELEPVGA